MDMDMDMDVQLWTMLQYDTIQYSNILRFNPANQKMRSRSGVLCG